MGGFVARFAAILIVSSFAGLFIIRLVNTFVACMLAVLKPVLWAFVSLLGVSWAVLFCGQFFWQFCGAFLGQFWVVFWGSFWAVLWAVL